MDRCYKIDRRTMMLQTAAAIAVGSLASAPRAADASAALNELFDQFMKENLDLSPITVTFLGLDTGPRAKQKNELDQGSEEAIARQKALVASQLARLKAFDRSTLGRSDAIGYDVVMYGLRTTDAANRAFQYGTGGAGAPYVLNQMFGGSYTLVPTFLDNQHTIGSGADADAYLARLGAFARLMDQEIEVARHDAALGVVPPDFVLAKTLAQMRTLRATAPEASLLVKSLVRRTAEKGIAGDYAGRAAAIVRDQIYPALDGQIALLAGYQATAVHDAGVWRLPDGDRYYMESLIGQTTTSKPAAEIHNLGLDLVADHSARIDALMKKQGMTTGSVGERLRAMFEDPKLQYPNTDAGKAALVADLNRRARSVRAKLPKYFGALPKAAVVIKRMTPEQEIGLPGGIYQPPPLDDSRPGIYWINLRDTTEQPRWLLGSLTYHESIPGHHLQLSIQQEAGLPLIRKVSNYTSYSEGWALYAEQLAVEMGEYHDDPQGLIGQLHDSMFRAVRLVVDTGIHAMQWSRERAIQYFTDTLGDPAAAATTEVERYCVMPGQACCYMLGKMKFLSERSKGQQALGPKFDLRKFHDAMLLPGAVPLDLLDGLYV